MTGFAITAVAVAPLVPDASQLPQTVVTAAVPLSGLDAQLEALASHDLALTRNDLTRPTDTPERLLARLGVNDPQAADFVRRDPTARKLISGRAGKMVQAHAGGDSGLIALTGRFQAEKSELASTHFSRVSMDRVNGRWSSRLEHVPLAAQVRLASGVIRTTLFAATDEARLPDAIAAQLSQIFAADVDFHRQLRGGDSFSIVYETFTADGEPIAWNQGAGRVLAAEFVSGGKAHHAIWFAGTDGRSGYFGLDGSSRRKVFLASPMEFSRVSSGFANRFHPILQNWRQHKGVDYSAPMGTPVRSVGEGVVDFAGRQNGYGNVVEIKHNNNRSTLYAHLSRIDVRPGQRVEQGQRVGAVGMTGWATGPHLHFEFRIAGQHQDPLLIARAADTVALDSNSRTRFAGVVQSVQAKLDLAETLGSSHGRSE
ncbi:MAG: M23 family metallopeptidase [Rhodoferax sp.]|nr:M23 family metallopeptidase [Rhodoferax sp.]